MDTSALKSAAFGGYDKKSVHDFLEELSMSYAVKITEITEENVKEKFIFVHAGDSTDANAKRLFRTDSASPSTKTLSALYVRVRRPVYKDGTEVDGRFSNIVTVWKRFNRGTRKIYIK